MPDQLESLLSRLHRQQAIPVILREIEQQRALLSEAPTNSAEFCPESDALLIVYPGNVRASGEAPLKTLSKCLSHEFFDDFRGLHLLPFYPSTSDFGFAVSNHRAVASEWGDRSDLFYLSKERMVIADLVLHHVSSQSKCFNTWLSPEAGRKRIFHKAPGNLRQLINGRHDHPSSRYVLQNGDPVNLLSRYGRDQVDLDHRSPRVLAELIKTMSWMMASGVSGIRLDAIAYAHKPQGQPVIHSAGTQDLARLINAIACALKPSAWVIPEIDSDVYGDLYLNANPTASGYAYGLAILIAEACLTGRGDALAAYLRTRTHSAQSITFLTTHDGLTTRVYKPVLPDDRISSLANHAQSHGWYVTRKNDTVYEINAPLHELLETRSEKTLELAYFLLLSSPGTPMFFLNTLLKTPPWHESVIETGDPRMVNRGSVSFEYAQQVLSSSPTPVLSALLGIRRRTPQLWRSAPITAAECDGGILKIHRSAVGTTLCAIANLSGESKSVPLHSGKSLINVGLSSSATLKPNDYDWIVYD